LEYQSGELSANILNACSVGFLKRSGI